VFNLVIVEESLIRGLSNRFTSCKHSSHPAHS